MILTTLLVLQSPNFHTISTENLYVGVGRVYSARANYGKRADSFRKKIEGRVRFVETGYRFTAKRVLFCLANRMAQITEHGLV